MTASSIGRELKGPPISGLPSKETTFMSEERDGKLVVIWPSRTGTSNRSKMKQPDIGAEMNPHGVVDIAGRRRVKVGPPGKVVVPKEVVVSKEYLESVFNSLESLIQ